MLLPFLLQMLIHMNEPIASANNNAVEEKIKSWIQQSGRKRSYEFHVDVDDPHINDALQFRAIYVYLVDSPGPFTCEKKHAYHSLDAYNCFVNGWVQTCNHRHSGSGFSIIKAMAMRSQSVTEKPHYAWVETHERDFSVESAHCACRVRAIIMMFCKLVVVSSKL